jgi:transposase
VIRRRLQRSEIAAFFADLPACLVGIEACAQETGVGDRAPIGSGW